MTYSLLTTGKGIGERLAGLGTVFYAPSMHSPSEDIYVFCEKHPGKRIPVYVSCVATAFERNEAILKAFESCPDCVEAKRHKTTRWPEGAEL